MSVAKSQDDSTEIQLLVTEVPAYPSQLHRELLEVENYLLIKYQPRGEEKRCNNHQNATVASSSYCHGVDHFQTLSGNKRH